MRYGEHVCAAFYGMSKEPFLLWTERFRHPVLTGGAGIACRGDAAKIVENGFEVQITSVSETDELNTTFYYIAFK